MYRTCKYCEKEKPTADFPIRNSKVSELRCKACRKEYNQEYRQKNLEKLREYDRNRWKTQREKRRESNRVQYIRQRAGRLKSAKTYYELNKEHLKIMTQKYHKEHPEKVRVNWSNRDARRRVAHYTKLKSDEIVKLLDVQKGRCFYCDNNLVQYHIDHIIPLCKGGKHNRVNLVLTCPSCNLRKNSKDPEVFVKEILENACAK